MSFISATPRDEATGDVNQLFTAAEERYGYIPNYLRLFSHRPEVFQAWKALEAAICRNMSLRRYELVTLAAARKLGATYCMLAHGSKTLNSGEVDEAQLSAIADDYHHAQLAPEEVAMMEFAERVVEQANSLRQADVDCLRHWGLSDAEILDITLAAAVRCFFAKTLDALGAEPDSKYLELDASLRKALSVGRPWEEHVTRETA